MTELFIVMLLLKTTVVLVATLGICKLLGGVSASVRHLLAAAGLASIAVLPLTSAIMPSLTVEVSSRFAEAPQTSGTVLGPYVAAGQDAPQIGVSTLDRASLDPRAASVTPGTLFTVLWFSGFAVLLSPLAAGLWQVRRLRRTGTPWSRGQALAASLAADVCPQMRLQIRLHEGVTGPMTCGVGTVTVLFPMSATGWRTDALRRALLHELEHARRRDWLVHCTARMVCAGYWFHPLAWTAWRRLRLEAERACDDAVVVREGAAEYAALLAQVAGASRGTRTPMLAMASRSDLAIRVSSLLKPNQPRGRVTAKTVVLAAMIVAGVTAVGGAVGFARESAQSAAAESRFDVASVKPGSPDAVGWQIPLHVGGFTATNVPLRTLLLYAYGLSSDQLVGGPSWQESRGFDIQAKPEGAADRDAVRSMLRSLLTERFQLKMHRELREMPIYALVVAGDKSLVSARLRPSAADCSPATQARADRLRADASVMLPLLRAGQGLPCAIVPVPAMMVPTAEVGSLTFRANGVSMSALARHLSPLLGRDVQDRTGLSGLYDWELTFDGGEGATVVRRIGSSEVLRLAPVSPMNLALPEPASPVPPIQAGPTLMVALQEQLHLKLESTRGVVEVLTIDSAELPAPN